MPAAASSTGAPLAKQKSRKGKAAWRKNIDTQDVDAALDEARARERAGLPVSSAISGNKAKQAEPESSSSLFVEDRLGDVEVGTRMARARRAQKPLRSLQVLDSTNAVPALAGRARSSFANPSTRKTNAAAQAKAMSKEQKDKLRKAAGRTVRGPFGAIVEHEQAREKGAPVDDADYDLWVQQQKKRDAEAKAKAEENEWIEQKKAVKVPRTIAAREDGVPAAISLPHEGQSYNPPAEAHDELLRNASLAALRAEEKKLAEAAFKSNWKAGGAVAALTEKGEFRVKGMLIGQGEGYEDDVESAESEAQEMDEDSDGEEAKGSKEPKRKTKAQRARAARVKAETAARLQAKAAKMQKAKLLALPAIKRSVARAEREHAAMLAAKAKAVEERRKADGLRGERFGKFRVPKEQEMDVQLGEDLADGLRSLKPEGNLFRDRFASMTTRGLAEPRKAIIPETGVGRGGMRGKKEIESHSYKRFV